MKIIVEGTEKEIAALVVAIQKQQSENETFEIYMDTSCLTKHDNREEVQGQ